MGRETHRSHRSGRGDTTSSARKCCRAFFMLPPIRFVTSHLGNLDRKLDGHVTRKAILLILFLDFILGIVYVLLLLAGFVQNKLPFGAALVIRCLVCLFGLFAIFRRNIDGTRRFSFIVHIFVVGLIVCLVPLTTTRCKCVDFGNCLAVQAFGWRFATEQYLFNPHERPPASNSDKLSPTRLAAGFQYYKDFPEIKNHFSEYGHPVGHTGTVPIAKAPDTPGGLESGALVELPLAPVRARAAQDEDVTFRKQYASRVPPSGEAWRSLIGAEDEASQVAVSPVGLLQAASLERAENQSAAHEDERARGVVNHPAAHHAPGPGDARRPPSPRGRGRRPGTPRDRPGSPRGRHHGHRLHEDYAYDGYDEGVPPRRPEARGGYYDAPPGRVAPARPPFEHYDRRDQRNVTNPAGRRSTFGGPRPRAAPAHYYETAMPKFPGPGFSRERHFVPPECIEPRDGWSAEFCPPLTCPPQADLWDIPYKDWPDGCRWRVTEKLQKELTVLHNKRIPVFLAILPEIYDERNEENPWRSNEEWGSVGGRTFWDTVNVIDEKTHEPDKQEEGYHWKCDEHGVTDNAWPLGVNTRQMRQDGVHASPVDVKLGDEDTCELKFPFPEYDRSAQNTTTINGRTYDGYVKCCNSRPCGEKFIPCAKPFVMLDDYGEEVLNCNQYNPSLYKLEEFPFRSIVGFDQINKSLDEQTHPQSRIRRDAMLPNFMEGDMSQQSIFGHEDTYGQRSVTWHVTATCNPTYISDYSRSGIRCDDDDQNGWCTLDKGYNLQTNLPTYEPCYPPLRAALYECAEQNSFSTATTSADQYQQDKLPCKYVSTRLREYSPKAWGLKQVRRLHVCSYLNKHHFKTMTIPKQKIRSQPDCIRNETTASGWRKPDSNIGDMDEFKCDWKSDVANGIWFFQYQSNLLEDDEPDYFMPPRVRKLQDTRNNFKRRSHHQDEFALNAAQQDDYESFDSDQFESDEFSEPEEQSKWAAFADAEEGCSCDHGAPGAESVQGQQCTQTPAFDEKTGKPIPVRYWCYIKNGLKGKEACEKSWKGTVSGANAIQIGAKDAENGQPRYWTYRLCEAEEPKAGASAKPSCQCAADAPAHLRDLGFPWIEAVWRSGSDKAYWAEPGVRFGDEDAHDDGREQWAIWNKAGDHKVCNVGMDTACPVAWWVPHPDTGRSRKQLDLGYFVSYFPLKQFRGPHDESLLKAQSTCGYFWYGLLVLWVYLLFSYVLISRMVAKFRKLRCVDTASMMDDYGDDDDSDDSSGEDGGVWGLIIGSSSGSEESSSNSSSRSSDEQPAKRKRRLRASTGASGGRG